MSPWLLIGTSLAVLYGLWLLLRFTFKQIDDYHAAWREERSRAAEPRYTGAEPVEETGQ